MRFSRSYSGLFSGSLKSFDSLEHNAAGYSELFSIVQNATLNTDLNTDLNAVRNTVRTADLSEQL